MVRHAPFVALLVVVSLACGACGSVPDLHFADDDGGADGGHGTGGPCVKTGPEICDDGIDNDCNGATDCADSACKIGYACVDRAPDGWEIRALAEGARPGCPIGFGESKDVRSIAGTGVGPPTCTCNCGGGATCGAGFDATFGSDATCGGSTENFAVKSQCDKLSGGFTVATNPFVKMTTGATPSCNANPQATLPPVVDARTCAAPRVGGGCKAAQVCAPKASGGYSVCVAKAGITSCPGDFPRAHRTGRSANDARACGACSCNATPCTGEVKLYGNPSCSGNEAVKLTATAPPGTCAQLTVPGFQARAYTSTVSGGCVASGASLGTGSLTFADEETVCCK